MKRIFSLADQVARQPTTVLLTGESGTGKEVVARFIHHRSPRRDQAFIAVNCPAITETLLESELFDHEKGSFTGASQSRRGRFELADGGTLFLDEIAEMGPGLQAKLLRVL
jgi:transcriptional regulator with GAF, ATPase, and Fis domain